MHVDGSGTLFEIDTTELDIEPSITMDSDGEFYDP